MPGNGHVRCGGRARETGRAESRHRALVRSHVRAIHAHARGLPRAINRLAITPLLAAYAAGKTIVDESSARAAIREEAAAATD
jgi:type II secretory pathway predicted ATPase ExeA